MEFFLSINHLSHGVHSAASPGACTPIKTRGRLHDLSLCMGCFQIRKPRRLQSAANVFTGKKYAYAALGYLVMVNSAPTGILKKFYNALSIIFF